MSRHKKWVTAAIICGGVMGGWYRLSTHQTIPGQVVNINLATRSDSFADHMNHKITNVTRLTQRQARPVIFDNDAANDDAMALLLIGNDPAVDLRAITVAGTGEAHGEIGAYNMAAVAALLGKSQVPVAYGQAAPISGAGKPFPDFLRAHADKLLANSTVAAPLDKSIGSDAVQLMQQVLADSKEKVTILATGPLTNVASLIKQYPSLKTKIDKVVIMGGAIKVPGNIHALMPASGNTVSEWNFFADPAAVKAVFASGVPVVLVPLDACNQVPMTRQFVEAVNIEDQPDLRLISQIMKDRHALLGEKDFYHEYYPWDALAAMVMVDPAVAETKRLSLHINDTNGAVRLAAHGEKGYPVSVVTTIHQPDNVLSNYVAMLKANHLFASRNQHQPAPSLRAQV